ncbi:oxygenase [Lithospermum erythrorhizon]|uniref:Lipoxygenase n=1 Tax=Lithospermum erythrorhizon TaxID=34254 RepID=A0AAV3Q6P5_LITER
MFSNIINNVSTVSQSLLKFDLPAIVKGDKFSWLRDSEFGRQAVVGVNPVSIELLKEFPILSKLDPAVDGPPESEITRDLIEQELNGMSIEEALQSKKLFILDHHDILLPFIERINSLSERKSYASRTIFFHTPHGTLKPIVIELSLPPKPFSSRNNQVLIPGHDATSDWIWRLAKAHIHACSETYILAAHRQLSSMHPIFKLLSPHMRYSLEINAISRQNLVNAGGTVEVNSAANRYGMELRAEYYKSMWRFDMEGLPADLLRRGMAVEDAAEPSGVRLVIEDYPYAADGLLIWSAIKELVESYVNHYYKDPASVNNDFKLQAWWSEIKNKGHQDKRSEPWWPNLRIKQDLCGILTTMIWIASGQHAVINYSQYQLGSYVPYRPAFMRKLIPGENDPEFDNFLRAPERYFFNSLPTTLEATKVMAVQENASTHSPDEEYLGQLQQLHSLSNNDPGVPKLFRKFTARLEEIENIITSRNKDQRLKNRCGAGVAPYEQLIPSSGPGVTGRGVPNSITI